LYLAGTISAGKAPAWVQILKLGMSGASRGGAKTIGSTLRRVGEALYGVYFMIVFLLWIIPTCNIVRFMKDHRAAGRFTNSALHLLFALEFLRLRVAGREYMDTPGAKFSAGNHTCYLDDLPLMMMGDGVPFRMLAKN